MSTRVLLIDDQPEVHAVINGILETKDYEVLSAENGRRGVEMAASEHPHVILLDILMHGMDGFEVCRELRQMPGTAEVPIIFLTGLEGHRHRLRGFDVGGTDYITKPFSHQEVLARVSAHAMKYRLLVQVQQERDRFRALSNATSEAVFIHDGLSIRDCNQAAERLTGYDQDDLVNMRLDELLPLTDGAPEEVIPPLFGRSDVYLQNWKRKRIPVIVSGSEFEWHSRKVGVLSVQDLRPRQRLENENRSLRQVLNKTDRFGDMIGGSTAMKRLYERIMQSAESDETVIIYGETGTGKELAARMIFDLSNTHKESFVSVNCGAIQETLFESLFFGHRKGSFTGAERNQPGYFEQAHGGALFLDEVGELTPGMQSKLLRVLQEGEYTPVGAHKSRRADVRIFAATNRPMRKLIQEGTVREDFYHRLHVLSLEVPPLRMRKSDIPLLVDYFLTQRTLADSSEKARIPLDIMDAFQQYDWPGNVRELFNELLRFLTTGEVELSLSRPDGNGAGSGRNSVGSLWKQGRSLNDALDVCEKSIIEQALDTNKGHRVNTARQLGIGRQTLYNKLRKHRISE